MIDNNIHDYNLDYLTSNEYKRYIFLLKSIYPFSYKKKIIDFNKNNFNNLNDIIDSINDLYKFKRNNNLFLNKLFNKFIYLFLAFQINESNYLKLNPYGLRGMAAYYSYYYFFYDYTILNEEVKEDFYNNYYKNIKLNEYKTNYNDVINLTNNKLLLSPSYYNNRSLKFKKQIRFLNKIFKNQYNNLNYSFYFCSPFYFNIYINFIDDETFIGEALIIPSSFYNYPLIQEDLAISVNRVKISYYENYFNEDLVILCYLNGEINNIDNFNEIINCLKNKLKNSDLVISRNRKIFDSGKINFKLKENQKIIVGSKFIFNEINNKDYVYNGIFWIRKLNKLDLKLSFMFKYYSDNTKSLINEDDIDLINNELYQALINYDFKNVWKKSKINRFYNYKYNYFPRGKIISSSLDYKHVKIEISPSLNKENIIEYIKNMFNLDENKLNIEIIVKDDEEFNSSLEKRKNINL